MSIAASVDVLVDATAPDGVVLTEGPHEDLYGHGTACAGIIRSLAPDVELVSVRVLGTDLRGNATLRRRHRLVHPQRGPRRQPEPVDEQRATT